MHPIPDQRWFSIIHTGLGRSNPSGQGPASGMKEHSLEALSCILHSKHDPPMYCIDVLLLDGPEELFCCITGSAILWLSRWPGTRAL